MPPQVLLFIVFLIILGLVAGVLARGTPGGAWLVVRRGLGGLCILIGVSLMVRGLAPLAMLFLLLGFSILGLAGIANINFPWASRSAGQRSTVRTSLLAMELDHDSGSLDGNVLAGQFSGARLSDLSMDELMVLRGECEAAADQSTALLDAYLDRAHEGWRDQTDHNTSQGAPASGGGQMSVHEAYEVLGLSRGVSADEVRRAHRELMKKYHPDRGGSEYLAQKINEARDALLAVLDD
jgi:hypothetical protein